MERSGLPPLLRLLHQHFLARDPQRFHSPQRQKLDDATRQLLSSIQDTHAGLRVIGQPVNITVNGKPAKNVELLGNSSIRENGEPIPERLRLLALRGKGNLIVYRIFIAPDVHIDALTPTFDQLTRTFILRE